MGKRTGVTEKILSLLNSGFVGNVKEISTELGMKKSAISGNMYRLESQGRIKRVPNTSPLVYRTKDGNNAPSRGGKTAESFHYRVSLLEGKTVIAFHDPVQIKTTENGVIINSA
jgi:hypothetical protein